jgi:hypothetical protein
MHRYHLMRIQRQETCVLEALRQVSFDHVWLVVLADSASIAPAISLKDGGFLPAISLMVFCCSETILTGICCV